MRDTLVRSAPVQRDFNFRLATGETRHYSVGASTLTGPDGKALGLIIIVADISARIRADDAVRAERNKLSAIMNGMGDAVLIVDTDRRINFANRLMETTFGGAALEGQLCYEVIGQRDTPCAGCAVDSGEGFSVEVCSAHQRYYMVTHSPIVDAEGKRYMVGVYKDITFRKGMEEELRNLTVTDTLTGLYNKRSFDERIRDEVARAGRLNTPLSLIFADIDKFKRLNDTHGHLVGDDCLRALGAIIRESIRDRVDAGFRYGGEEFVILVTGSTASQAAVAAGRIREAFAARVFASHVEGAPPVGRVTVSLGVARHRPGETPESLTHRADEAMYRAKREGGDRVLLAEGDGDETADAG